MPECPKCRYRFEIKRRTNKQNNTYWKFIITPLAEYISYAPEECHDLMKYKFNREIRYIPDGKGNKIEDIRIKSTTILTTKEYSDYIENILQWASSIGCVLIMPKEE